MAHFSKQEIEEIRQRLAATAVKDSQFPDTVKITLDDFVAIIQHGVNKKLTVNAFASFVAQYIDGHYVLLVLPYITRGSNMLRPGQSADVVAKVMILNEDVTERIPESYFSWERSSKDPEGDIIWNQNHENVGKVIHVAYNEIKGGCTICCVLPLAIINDLM